MGHPKSRGLRIRFAWHSPMGPWWDNGVGVFLREVPHGQSVSSVVCMSRQEARVPAERVAGALHGSCHQQPLTGSNFVVKIATSYPRIFSFDTYALLCQVRIISVGLR